MDNLNTTGQVRQLLGDCSPRISLVSALSAKALTNILFQTSCSGMFVYHTALEDTVSLSLSRAEGTFIF